MFEAEIEMEKKSASWLPLLLIILLAAGVIGGVGYYIYMSTHGALTAEQAAPVIAEALKARTATTHFHTGTVVPSVNEKPDGPNYRLLQKAGLLKITSGKGAAKVITLTPEGEKAVSAFPEFKPAKETDGTLLYDLPLAQRKLVSVTKITMQGLSAATVEYTWKWEPNQMGELFDASSAIFSTFPSWDRQTLIDKYGADFYHGEPAKMTMQMTKTDKGWQVGR
jgi:hypothetical protein